MHIPSGSQTWFAGQSCMGNFMILPAKASNEIKPIGPPCLMEGKPITHGSLLNGCQQNLAFDSDFFGPSMWMVLGAHPSGSLVNDAEVNDF